MSLFSFGQRLSCTFAKRADDGTLKLIQPKDF
jgi:hypothetical protein